MKTIIIVLAALCLATSGFAQTQNNIAPLNINYGVPDITFPEMINYKDTTARLSDFKGKLVILDFWGTYCAPCIAEMPKNDSLQRLFKDKLQFILVNDGAAHRSADFLKKWNAAHAQSLSIPMVAHNKEMNLYFPHRYIPYYVWLLPGGKVLAVTSAYFVNRETIQNTLDRLEHSEATHSLIN